MRSGQKRGPLLRRIDSLVAGNFLILFALILKKLVFGMQSALQANCRLEKGIGERCNEVNLHQPAHLF
ncbi:MAG: hypothetical protein CSA75_04025 [Sorangium cellulosum]|nr:MAG: hypothetical protein CSA75_04025 [Sorangium cellulosum]